MRIVCRARYHVAAEPGANNFTLNVFAYFSILFFRDSMTDFLVAHIRNLQKNILTDRCLRLMTVQRACILEYLDESNGCDIG